MQVSLRDVLQKLPGPQSAAWPEGRFAAEVLAHGTMTLEVFAPRGRSDQAPRPEDRLVIIAAGQAATKSGDDAGTVMAGDALLVPAGDTFQIIQPSDDFIAWIVAWGPEGGEAEAPSPSVFAAIDA
ncbi:hypothetical protein LQ948_07260 [Jiella sp. MQZ9-1]|uniref:Cupin n=1 Tax=Jiella flava TaxID=2816857 RepID=A0A939JVN8_9HYPH|nr:hypothetical protein [Jiella flava]MBO0662167.1 hypothetical protein [Jiella flava]MCD2471003.1 hypothetical protein [Jiella flava]